MSAQLATRLELLSSTTPVVQLDDASVVPPRSTMRIFHLMIFKPEDVSARSIEEAVGVLIGEV